MWAVLNVFLFLFVQLNLCKTATFKKTKNWFSIPIMALFRSKVSDQLSLNAGQKYCRMLQEEHSAILSTFIELPFVIKIFVLSIFGWPFYRGFSVTDKTVLQLINFLFI